MRRPALTSRLADLQRSASHGRRLQPQRGGITTVVRVWPAQRGPPQSAPVGLRARASPCGPVPVPPHLRLAPGLLSGFGEASR